ncbi:MAG: MBOAT family O-acyltransferase [Oliverpabstia intestinalis]|nr:MBOAT family O-acyltransferase [Oliverpabstia intestinalis]MDY5791131.1 MBOAT family O-acyltransferase [Oliverpabstia intestinalis]
MVFSSLFFVFFFLALNLIAYHFADGIKRKNMVLLGFSLVFYSWGGPKYLLLLLSMVFASWLFALLIDQYREEGLSKIFLICDCVFMLGLLCIFKYLTFFSSITNTIFHFPKEIPQIALPIGISFYTFQLLSYVIDVYREEVAPQRKFVNLLLYASLFHQCIAGPIVRYQLVADEIENRKVKTDELYRGIKRFTIGLAKKAILANGCASVADTLVPTLAKDIAEIPAAGLWIGMLFYALQIYLDFSAYSDMAIGMGLMVGFHYDENFNYPYISGSIKEFWNRWHISLGTFFRDYVYIPLGGNRKGARRRTINLLIVWGLTGFWHGASWNFIAWGLGNWVVIMISQELEPLYQRFHNRFHVRGSFFFRLFQVIRTVLLMSCLRMFDCYRDVPLTFRMFGSMFTGGNWKELLNGSLLQLGLTLTDYRILFFGLVLLIAVSLIQRTGSVREKIRKLPYWGRFVLWYGLFLCVLLMGAYGVGYDASQFIYNQF